MSALGAVFLATGERRYCRGIPLLGVAWIPGGALPCYTPRRRDERLADEILTALLRHVRLCYTEKVPQMVCFREARKETKRGNSDPVC